MSFEDRLGELFRNEDPHAAGPEPAAVIAGARRRRARRRAGAGAAALAVALICGATAVTAGGGRPAGNAAAGNAAAELEAASAPSTGAAGSTGAAAPTPTGSPTPSSTRTALPLSPVRQVAPGEKILVTDDTRIWFTANQRCDESRESDGSWHTSFGCRDVRSDNLEHDKPSVYAQTSGNRDRSVVASFYLGPTPSRIVAFFDGKPTVATIVTTAGMKGWTGYYVVLPPMPTGDPSAHRRPAGPAIGVYDAEGKLLAENPGTASDGSDERAPQRL
ncbi:hypothetical protein ACIG0C_04755 [Kitasatospora aureofaciens]|uniref:Uncharacterized protein n=1 Tax=Kitasatospora aureofaciens TaxID=1894 RepID=A0A8H9LQ34_KITAU|nr:hypothetical protein [Kitasatospora aureofaciens]ARF78928.1 hypothetical protein B6264_08365 [Kitasatospora aureofaciens]QEV00133.1 hypothetical protein CP971_13310 [Streptomyces viridifaciens]UKZ06327.1 hypothetical protein BOQ63_020195 [Streptomyces viridifaciens]GGU76176.1 hypothetical protein GCM10010502_29860 [Kitasatospora aureofaciens]